MADELVDQVFAPEAPAEVTPPPAEPPAPAPEPTPEAPPAETPATTPEPESPPQAEKPEHTVPLPKYLDLRDENKELRRWKAEQEAKAQAPKAPDPIDDPEGHTAFLESRMEARLAEQRLTVSEQLAVREHGQEKVDAAVQWALSQAQADPSFGPRYMREADPIGWIVRQHQRDSLVSQLPPDVSSLDELVEREIAKRGLSAPLAPAAPAVVAPVPAADPPRSIASEPAASGAVVDDTGDFLTGLLRK